MMLTVVWSPTELATVMVIKSGCRTNSGYDANEVTMPISERWDECRGGTFRKLMVRADTTRPQNARISQQSLAQSGMGMAAHLPYSPDLAPSDFCLFGSVKVLLRGESFETGEAGEAVFSDSRLPSKVGLESGFARVDDETRAMY
jgi:hypothetical protein